MLEEVADGGAGGLSYRYAAEKAEGMYVPRDSKLEWMTPERENITSRNQYATRRMAA